MWAGTRARAALQQLAMCVPAVHKPRRTALHRLVAANIEAFFETEEGKPAFIRRTFTQLLGCGKPENGGGIAMCTWCGFEHLIGFSCKLRGLCPSCSARAAAEGSEQLIRRVLPHQAFRHLVVNYPIEVTQKLAFQPPLVSAVESVVDRVLVEWMENRCGGASSGGVHFRHRFGSNVNVQMHAHILLLDGGYNFTDDEQVRFVSGAAITQGECDALAEELYGRIEDVLIEHEVFLTGTSTAQFEQPRVGMVARHKGLHLFASTPVSGRDDLKRLCCYLLRSGVDASRMRELPDGQFAYRLNKKDAKGQQEMVLSGPEWMKKLASIIPAARKPVRRYFGVMAGGSKLRKHIVPKREKRTDAEGKEPQRIPWATLMKLVFGADALMCPHCKHEMTVVSCHGESQRARALQKRLQEELAPRKREKPG